MYSNQKQVSNALADKVHKQQVPCTQWHALHNMATLFLAKTMWHALFVCVLCQPVIKPHLIFQPHSQWLSTLVTPHLHLILTLTLALSRAKSLCNFVFMSKDYTLWLTTSLPLCNYCNYYYYSLLKLKKKCPSIMQLDFVFRNLLWR